MQIDDSNSGDFVIKTKQEYAELISDLLDQIEYYRQSRVDHQRFLCKLLDMNMLKLSVLGHSEIAQFLTDQIQNDRKSGTMIEKLVNFAEKYPEAFEAYKKKIYG